MIQSQGATDSATASSWLQPYFRSCGLVGGYGSAFRTKINIRTTEQPPHHNQALGRNIDVPVRTVSTPVPLAYLSLFLDPRLSSQVLSVVKPLEKSFIDPRVARLYDVSDNWNGQGEVRPNANAIKVAAKILKQVELKGIKPTKVVRSAPGGVFLKFSNEDYYAHVEVFNDGELVFAVRNGDETPNVSNFVIESLDDIIHQINVGVYRRNP